MQPLPPAIGRYEVRQRIGQGGMGALFLALDPAIDRLVALKLLRVDNEETRARFRFGARCERASATAFVPVLWVITESVELDADSQPSR
jgi:serine/threonine protein kinase